jgi:hypothetical protein
MRILKEITRRLVIFYVILIGCLSLSRALEKYLTIEEGVPKYITGHINMFSFLFLLIWVTGHLKFEPIR